MNLGARREPANRLPSIKYPLQSEMTNRQIYLIALHTGRLGYEISNYDF